MMAAAILSAVTVAATVGDCFGATLPTFS